MIILKVARLKNSESRKNGRKIDIKHIYFYKIILKNYKIHYIKLIIFQFTQKNCPIHPSVEWSCIAQQNHGCQRLQTDIFLGHRWSYPGDSWRTATGSSCSQACSLHSKSMYLSMREHTERTYSCGSFKSLFCGFLQFWVCQTSKLLVEILQRGGADDVFSFFCHNDTEQDLGQELHPDGEVIHACRSVK